MLWMLWVQEGEGDAPLGYASLTRLTCLFQADFQPPWEMNYDWSLTQAASPEMANYDWMLAHTVSPFQPSREENYDRLLTQAASPFLLRGRILSGSLRGAFWGGVFSLPLVGMP